MNDRQLGSVTVLGGERGGRYPHGNSLLVAGREQRVIIDPSLSLASRAERPVVDALLLSHCHEDHLAGGHLFPDVPCHAPEADALGARSLDGLMTIYGMAHASAAAYRQVILEQFHYEPRTEVLVFEDGAQFDLGGGVRIHAVHAPGHTRGHTVFHIEPDDVLYLGDIDLSSFGPYYGDAWSSLEDFERTLQRVRAFEARYYATFHHIGVLEGRAAFLERLDRFTAMIGDRETRLMQYLREPRSLEDVVQHRFIYRPGDQLVFANDVERRSMEQHVARLVAQHRVAEVEAGRYVALGDRR